MKSIICISMDPQILKGLDDNRGLISRSRYIEVIIDEVCRSSSSQELKN